MDNSFELQSLLSTAYSVISDEELKDFKDSASDATRVVCSRPILLSNDAICQFIQQNINTDHRDKMGTNAKFAEESERWREKGNGWFQTRHYKKALLCYTKSVCFAPYNKNHGDHENQYTCVSDDTELATAFGNRSAALYHLDQYELAVQDCDRAVRYGYPCTLMYKVLQRKGQCLLKLGQHTRAARVFEQALQSLDQASNLTSEKKDSLRLGLERLLQSCLNSSIGDVQNASSQPSISETLAVPSVKLASASHSVGLQQSKDKGRYLVADMPLHAGELIIRETPYAVVLLPEYHLTHCHYCCQTTFNPVPCPSCTDVQYCNDQCLRSAEEAYHWLECGLGDCLKTVSTLARLSLRMLLGGYSEQISVSQEMKSADQIKHLASCSVNASKQPNSHKLDAQIGEDHDTSQQPSENHSVGEKLGLCDVIPQTIEAVRLYNCSGECSRTNLPNSQGGSVGKQSTLCEVKAQSLEAANACDCCGKCLLVHHPSSQGDSTTENATQIDSDQKITNSSLCTRCKDHIDTDSQTAQGLVMKEHSTCASESQITKTSYPHGCGQDGIYRSDYRAVYTLMPHTEHHTTQELFNMTVTSLLLSKCVQPRLSWPAEWDDYTAKTFHLPTSSKSSKTNKESLQSKDKTQSTSGCSKNLSFGTDSCKDAPNLGNKSEPKHGDETEEKIATLLLRHLQQLTCNAHAVTAIETEIPTLADLSLDEPSKTRPDIAERPSDSKPTDTRVHGDGSRNIATVVETTKQVRLAIAVYLTTSLLNHACEPNVIASFDGAVLSMRATRDMLPGEEILHCYGPHAKHMTRDDRQRALQKEYFFTCTCHACSSTPDDEIEMCDWSNAYGCSRCRHVLQVQGKGANQVSVCMDDKCRHKHSLKKLCKEEMRASSLFQLAQQLIDSNKIEESLSCLHECYTIQCDVLYKHHKAVAETEDCLAKCYSLTGDFKKAGTYLRLSVATVEKQFGAKSIELAYELHKLAQVLFNGGEVQEALGIIGGAIKLLTLHFGPNHADVQELNQMKMCLLSL